MADLPWYVSLTLFLVGIVVFFLLLAYNRSIGRFYVSCCSKGEERQKRRAAARNPPSQQRPRRPFSMTPPPDVSFGTAGLDNVHLTQDVEAQTASQDKTSRGWFYWRREKSIPPTAASQGESVHMQNREMVEARGQVQHPGTVHFR
jgi:hypothetical protein